MSATFSLFSFAWHLMRLFPWFPQQFLCVTISPFNVLKFLLRELIKFCFITLFPIFCFLYYFENKWILKLGKSNLFKSRSLIHFTLLITCAQSTITVCLRNVVKEIRTKELDLKKKSYLALKLYFLILA